MLDVHTLLFTATMLNVALALALFFYWRTQKTYAGFGYWTMAQALVALAYLLFAFRGIIPETISVWLASVLGLFALAVRNEGVKHFWSTGQRQFQKRHGMMIGVWALVLLATIITNNPSGRILLLAAGQIYYAGMIAYRMLPDDRNAHYALSGTIAVLHLSYCVLLALRAVERIVDAAAQDILAATFMNTVFWSFESLTAVGVAGLFLMLNSQHLARELLISRKELENLATVDSLTGIYNRRKLFELGEKEMIRSRRLEKSFSLLLFDVDFFKKVNDTYGHSAGDELLLHIVRIIQQNIRAIDIFGRLGGDEFVIFFPETGILESYKIAERMRQAMDNSFLAWENRKIPVKISIGVVELAKQDESFNDLLNRADYNLYKAKHEGRNQVAGKSE